MPSSNKTYLILLYCIIILKYPIFKDDQENSKILEFYRRDIEFCPQCFVNQLTNCENFENELKFSFDLIGSVNCLIGVKQSRLAVYKNSKIVVKYTGKEEPMELMKDAISSSKDEETLIERISDVFSDDSRVDGTIFCPLENISRFLDIFRTEHSLLSLWVHLNTNFQPIILPILYEKGFPVPKVYGTCGLTLFESYDGEILGKFYLSSFKTKLEISIQLLEGALKFTEGFEGYRMYFTDANPDNIVYDKTRNRVSFVDLDNLIIVDSNHTQSKGSQHKHEAIPCDGCFAYAPREICAASRSDLNIFQICQILREDLNKDRTKGFLYPIPEFIAEDYTDLGELLDYCMECREGECTNRFDVVDELLDVLKIILSEL